jgi:hypothetical protein
MKIFKWLAVVTAAAFIFASCQKELQFDGGASVGTLKSAVTGDCLPANLNGTYKVDSILTSDNYIDVQADVTVAGTFDVRSDTVNGFSFSKTGNINTGSQTMRLYASGKPLAAGTNLFTIKYGTSVCTFAVTVMANPAVYTLGGAPGNCSGVTLAGTYMPAVTMTAANTVTMSVNVVSIGYYSASTNSVNGVSFTKTGSFTATGTQTITLTATGTPLLAGTFTYPVTAGTSNCNFPVTYTAPPPTNNEYIPETLGSNWSRQLVGGLPGDTTYTYVTSNTSVNGGQTYKHFLTIVNSAPTDSTFQRSSLGQYFTYVFGTYGILDNPVNTEVMLLDSNLAVNGTWSKILPPNSVGGFPVTVRIDAQILAKGATATIAGNSYNNVIKVKFTFLANIGAGYTPYIEQEFWYAKGLGLIYSKQNDVPVTTTTEYETTRIQIF